MSTVVYPNGAGFSMPAPIPTPFFSGIPRAILPLCQQGILKARDIQVLALLLDYRNKAHTLVGPCQTSLARRLACSVDTVQRSLSRLVTAKLIVKLPQRDHTGRLHGLLYDIAHVLNLIQSQAAKVRRGADTAQRPSASQNDFLTTPQNCGVEESKESVDKADSANPSSEALPLCPVALEMTRHGVAQRVAAVLITRYGEARCRQALAAAALKQRIRDRAAWLVACITQEWTLPDNARPRAQQPYRMPQSSTPTARAGDTPADPLQTLSPDRYAILEDQARAEVVAEALPAFKSRFARNANVIRARMRHLLSSPSPSGGGAGEGSYAGGLPCPA